MSPSASVLNTYISLDEQNKLFVHEVLLLCSHIICFAIILLRTSSSLMLLFDDPLATQPLASKLLLWLGGGILHAPYTCCITLFCSKYCMFCKTMFPLVIMIGLGLMFSRFRAGLPDLTVGGRLSE